MNIRSIFPVTTALLLAVVLVAPSGAEAQSPQALVDHLLKARETVGFRGQVQAVSKASRSGGALSMTLRVRGRQDRAITQLLYQAISPRTIKGQALVLNFSPSTGLSGFYFAPPDTVKPLPRDVRAVPFFNSQLSLEEVVEDFWYWPGKKSASHETLLKHDCQIVEFRPSAQNVTSFSVVKVWIATDINLPLRIQKLYPGSKGSITIDSRKILRQGSHWVTSEFNVKTTDGRPDTLFSFINGELDTAVPADDFTAEGLKKKLKDQVDTAGQRP